MKLLLFIAEQSKDFHDKVNQLKRVKSIVKTLSDAVSFALTDAWLIKVKCEFVPPALLVVCHR